MTFLEAVPEFVNQATSISPAVYARFPPIVQHLGWKGKTGAGRFLFRFGHFRHVSLATVSDYDDGEASRESRKANAAEEHRDYLSEFCHPNNDAFANYFEWEERYSDAIERVRCRRTRRNLPRKPQSRRPYQTF